MIEIIDAESARSWLSQQDRQTRVRFVARMALRSFPAAIGEAPFDQENTLRLLHHLLIATVASFDLGAARKAARFAFGSVSYAGSAQQIYNDQLFFASPHPSQNQVLYGDEQPPAGSLRREVAENAISNALAWAVGFSEPDPSVEYGGGFWELAWLAGAENAAKLAKSDVAALGEWPPLWDVNGRPSSVLGDYSNLDDLVVSDKGVWGFWLRWFKAIHDGKPMPWELSGLIASTLSDQDWKSGPAHVAREIEKIEALFSVRQSLSELEKDRTAVISDSRLGIGGNNPPEEVELPSSLRENYAIIWAAVDEIAEQAEAEEPDKSLILSTLKKLTDALKSCLSWVGRKADLAIDTAIKWSIPAAGGYFVLNPSKFQALIEAVRNWSATLP
ncbi:hypothetical protein HW561_09575 [Rhodobacteraceae bacterium B1Z28]|uniref:Uncharacterized protein n=1 Tax=Ruegeria haliotis TaxID=2747601 RepID=A0ABX2PPG3_9RHOB|nr:hypothetical protein [Ruegeria haliotis]NVO56036.1 hypothetical protein [Ruegeria haliotis]